MITDWNAKEVQSLLSYLGSYSYCSKQYNLLYIATPKVACTSLAWWFAGLEGYEQCLREERESVESDPDLVIHDAFHKVAPDITGLHPDALVEPLTSDSFFRFAVVRNPYKRIFSAWQSKILLKEPLQSKPYLNCNFFNQEIESKNELAKAFEGFLEYIYENEDPEDYDIHWASQTNLLRPDLVDYSILVKLEKPEELTTALAEKLGDHYINPFDSRHVNESLMPYQRDFFTERSVELIRCMYEDDFKVFNYSMTLPEDKVLFTEVECRLAMKASKAIQRRNQRIAELSYENNSWLESEIVKRDAMLSAADASVEQLKQDKAWMESQLAEFESNREWAENLSKGNAWLESEVAKRDALLKESRAWIEQQDGSKAWLESEIAKRDALLKESRAWIEQQDGSKAWLESEVAKRDALLKESRAWIEQQDGSKAWLESEVAKRDALLKESRAWAEQLNNKVTALFSNYEQLSMKFQILSANYEQLSMKHRELSNRIVGMEHSKVWRVAKFLHLVK